MRWGYIVNEVVQQYVDVPADQDPHDTIPAFIADACELLEDWVKVNATRVNGEWVNPPEEPEPPVDPEPTPSEWIGIIATRRYQAEIAGVQWLNYLVETEREAKANLTTELMAADKGLRVDTDGWKLHDITANTTVYRVTTNAEILEMFTAVFGYVRLCFAREGVLLGKIADNTITQADVDTGWPATVTL